MGGILKPTTRAVATDQRKSGVVQSPTRSPQRPATGARNQVRRNSRYPAR